MKFRHDHTPWLPDAIALVAKAEGRHTNDICCICLEPITMQIYRNSGVCSEQHRKIRDNDLEPFVPINLKIHEGEDK